MHPLTDNISTEADSYRIKYMLKTFPRPWKVEKRIIRGNGKWVVEDASGRQVYLAGRGALILAISAINAYEA